MKPRACPPIATTMRFKAVYEDEVVVDSEREEHMLVLSYSGGSVVATFIGDESDTYCGLEFEAEAAWWQWQVQRDLTPMLGFAHPFAYYLHGWGGQFEHPVKPDLVVGDMKLMIYSAREIYHVADPDLAFLKPRLRPLELADIKNAHAFCVWEDDNGRFDCVVLQNDAKISSWVKWALNDVAQGVADTDGEEAAHKQPHQ